MSLDMSLLYGEMAGSFLLHAVLPFLAVVFLSNMTELSASTRGALMIGICAIASFVIQGALLTALQANACGKVYSMGNIGVSAFLAAIVTAIFVAIPVYVESMRLVVSQLAISHMPLLTPGLRKAYDLITNTAVELANIDASDNTIASPESAALTPEQYETQTLQETKWGAAYWAAFAGAYGIGIGSYLSATTCPAS